MPVRRAAGLALLGLLSVAAPLPAQPTSPSRAVIAARQAFNAAIERWRSTFATDSLYGCVRTPDQVTVNAPWGLADEAGHWRCRYAGVPAGAPPGYATGIYNGKWQRDVGGSWRLHAEIFTTRECVGQSTACVRPDSVPTAASGLLPAPVAGRSSAAAVRAARDWYNRAIARRDANAIAALFTPDYHAVFGRGAHIEGVEAARADWIEEFRTNGPASCIRTADRVTVNDDWGLAHERGHWQCRATVKGAMARPSGRYTAKWERDVTGRWRVQAELFTTLQCVGAPAGSRPPDPLPMR
ncbi:YybH family protein [Gemmatimonas sp.]|jgi:ketosteroid isomerase-like protein|uniref:YybH family protein n=1 Tax=Gemmatimonas sp. TaxID=1962908 RepID=UPI0037BE8FEA